MTAAKFASLHGGLLARKGKAMPATVHHGVDFAVNKIDGRPAGEVDAEPQSAKEFSAPWLHLSDRIQRLNGDPEMQLNGGKHFLDTEMPAPEPETHAEMEIPAVISAAPEVKSESDKRIQEAIEARLLLAEPVDIERRQLDQPPPLDEQERPAGEPWDGTERRKANRGLLPGVPERRKPPVFGKRGASKTSAADTSQKRFNA